MTDADAVAVTAAVAAKLGIAGVKVRVDVTASFGSKACCHLGRREVVYRRGWLASVEQREELEVIAVHELSHILSPPVRVSRWRRREVHGPEFRRHYLRALERWFGRKCEVAESETVSGVEFQVRRTYVPGWTCYKLK